MIFIDFHNIQYEIFFVKPIKNFFFKSFFKNLTDCWCLLFQDAFAVEGGDEIV